MDVGIIGFGKTGKAVASVLLQSRQAFTRWKGCWYRIRLCRRRARMRMRDILIWEESERCVSSIFSYE